MAGNRGYSTVQVLYVAQQLATPLRRVSRLTAQQRCLEASLRINDTEANAGKYNAHERSNTPKRSMPANEVFEFPREVRRKYPLVQVNG